LAPESYQDFNKELVAVSEGKSKFSWESRNLTLTGEPIEVRVIWSAVPGYENDLAKVFVSIEDITERKQMEMKLRESEESFRSLYENATIGIYRTTPDGRILMANQALIKMLGFGSFDELAGRNLNNEGFESKPSRQEYQRRIEKESEIHGQESVWKRKDGSTIYVRESARLVKDDKGKTLYYDGTVEDISQRHIAEKALSDSESELQALFASMKDLVIVYNKDGRYLKIAATDARQLIMPSKDLIGKTIHEILPKGEADRWVSHILHVLETQKANHIEYSLKIDNREIWFDASVSPLSKDTVIWVARDITDRKLLEEKTRFIGTHDSLTKLYNRSFFEEELSRLKKSRLYPVSIFMIDVDGLKLMNDSQGHAAGDQLLLRTAQVLLKSFRSEDMVARVGGDEFVVIVPATNEEAARLALIRIKHFLQLDNKNNPETELKISIGSATGNEPGSLSRTLKEADALMYQNKQARKLQAAREKSKLTKAQEG
jgi:diguanylate cyclase (GGDEF)-like protein/PAS domain S-box-containing protein